ncbi:MAG: hypothetical protein FWF87_08055 [Synergistaceae bacterium]|nr:hypothetical protein [Synergistaceae bacterium]
MERFIASALSVIEVVSVPLTPYLGEDKIRDPDDRLILRATIKAGADIIITGDNDFLDSYVSNPKVMTAAQFVQTG